MPPPSLSLVPAWRLGTLLRDAREQAGRSLDELAGRSTEFDRADLTEIEAGTRALDDDAVRALVALYAVDPDGLVPARHELVVDLDHHELAAAGRTQALAGPAPSADEVLGSYLSLVYTLRAAEPGTPLPLRAADLDVLSQALALARSEITHRIEHLIAEPDREVRPRSSLLRARFLVPAAGVLVAVCAGAALVVYSVHSTPVHSTPPASSSPAAIVPASVSPSTSAATSGSTRSGGAPVVEANDLPSGEVPAGGVGLAPAQVVTRGPNGQPVQSDRTATPTSTTTSTSTP